jgi:hypothetical protein
MNDYHIDWLLEPTLAFRKNIRRALAAPDTAINRMERAARSAFDRRFAATPGAFEAWLASVMDAASSIDGQDWEQGKSETLARIQQSPAIRRAWPLIERAHVRVPNSPFVAIPNPVGWARACFRALGALDRISRRPARGEDWARRALAAFACVADVIYFTYLAKLQLIYQAAAGTKPTRPRSLGWLCKALAQIPETAHLVFSDAAHFRNAFAHEHFRYLGGGRLELWDGVSRARQWEMNLRAVEVRDRAIQMLEQVGGFMGALNMYADLTLTDILEPLLREWRGSSGSGSEGLRAFFERHDARMRAAFAAIPQEFGDLHGVGEDAKLCFGHRHLFVTPAFSTTRQSRDPTEHSAEVRERRRPHLPDRS